MSRSKPAREKNPATRFFEWRGGDGHIQYYDKDLKDNITVDLPFRMIVLDQLSTVAGFNKKLGGIYSNEVRSTKREDLHVRFFEGGDIATGKWQDIKEKVNYKSGKFATSVYVAYKDGDEWKLGRFQMMGSSLGSWIEFNTDNRDGIGKMAVQIERGEPNTKGIAFVPPKFSLVDITEEEDEIAKDLDVQLQAYLSGYLAQAEPEDQSPEVDPEDYTDPDPDGKRPF